MTSDQKVLVIAEHFQGEIISSTSKAINCASQISSHVDLLLLSNDSSLSDRASRYDLSLIHI